MVSYIIQTEGYKKLTYSLETINNMNTCVFVTSKAH